MNESTSDPLIQDVAQEVLDAVAHLCDRYEISSLQVFLASCRAFAEEKTVNIGVLGRFKAGKSTFLNHLIGRELLPVGVIPVTSAITEIQYGARERATVSFLDGRVERAGVDRLAEYISESENPANTKQVRHVLVELPEMQRYRGIRFVDTPGLDSVFEHNTEASLDWLPNVGLALVAVGVDPPLSQHDIELIRKLSRYTPKISLLLTKIDTLDAAERSEVQHFVQQQLDRSLDGSVPVYPYSVREGFEDVRARLESDVLGELRRRAEEHRNAILLHKLDSLLSECEAYLNVALRSAETADTDREHLRGKILGGREMLEDARLALKLIVRHGLGSVRPTLEGAFQNDQAPLTKRLQADLDRDFPGWSRSIGVAIDSFDAWLQNRLRDEIEEVSNRHKEQFIEPARRASRQLSQSLQDFRNRLSERTLEALGVPLQTTEMELRIEEPRSPDIRVGKIFDRNWELISFLIPMSLVKNRVKRHFEAKVAYFVFINFSRLVAQWEDILRNELLVMDKESRHRLDSVVSTIERLVSAAAAEAPQIREDVRLIDGLRRRLSP